MGRGSALERIQLRPGDKEREEGDRQAHRGRARPRGLRLAKTAKVKGSHAVAEASGAVKLAVKPRGNEKQSLKRSGEAKVTANVTYTPTGGSPNSKHRKLKLIKRQAGSGPPCHLNRAPVPEDLR